MSFGKSTLVELVQNLITLLTMNVVEEKKQTVLTAIYVTVKTIGLLIEIDPKVTKDLVNLKLEDFHE